MLAVPNVPIVVVTVKDSAAAVVSAALAGRMYRNAWLAAVAVAAVFGVATTESVLAT